MKDIVNDRITELRVACGKSQKEVADDLGVKRDLYKHWENGTREIKANTIKALAYYYGVSADYILGLCMPEMEDWIPSQARLDEIKKSMRIVNLAKRFYEDMEELLE